MILRTRQSSVVLSLLLSFGAIAAMAAEDDREPLFQLSQECVGCHNGLQYVDGSDISIGTTWSSSMMANSGRDPYWQAGVRREVMDHPDASDVIEMECSRCHMPMSHHMELMAGTPPSVLAHLPLTRRTSDLDVLAKDGVSCAVCHQIEDQKLGDQRSFSGHFVLAPMSPGPRRAYGPFEPDQGRARLMESAVGHRQEKSIHIQKSQLCATCHTLFTHAVGADGPPLPEQVPYLEWVHSDYANEMSCQDCHMPELKEQAKVASVLGRPQSNVSQHVFRGGNFVLPQIFRRFGAELAVDAGVPSLASAERRTREHLQSNSATLTLDLVRTSQSVAATITIANQAGHKLPTAYPSRRAWIHFKASDVSGEVLFESGKLLPNGAIAGNDNDADGATFEPHHQAIASGDDVQIYEDIMGDPMGRVTTGLLSGSQYLKDNRLLPDGFDKSAAPREVAVHGHAVNDPDFSGGGDLIRYRFDAAGTQTVKVTARLLYQPIGYRWAMNLADYDAFEPKRFVRYFSAIGETSTIELAVVETTLVLQDDGPADSPQ